MWRKINFLAFLFASLLSYSQKKETITIKKQDEIYFYRTGNFKDSVITKNMSDIFYIDITGDLKKYVEIKLNNATFLKTNDSTRFKLVYTPGMKYRLVYANSAGESASGVSKYQDSQAPLEAQIATDGAASTSNKNVIIELCDTKANKILIKNVFVYKENK
jgi:hypothetical protein